MLSSIPPRGSMQVCRWSSHRFCFSVNANHSEISIGPHKAHIS
jgi:hypothetical protein